ncbi:SCP2 sterol-binding domain-containing protein [Eisenibacter elegans]|jgi:putative sterol carrier protein|uniref:SCP2 sterol-binding domain-containing protein n=1 Tax=Eisenibacter elegans TaxID=997 RepID=UPI000420FE75|nr:SCP2 sterol-binding domain-containing protein [Eisenibacter elegans]
MSLEATTAKVNARSAQTADLGASVKFTFSEGGVVYLDGQGGVSNEDKDAACTVSISIDDFNSMLDGDLNPMNAFMGGKMQIDGDMSIAMKLQAVFS